MLSKRTVSVVKLYDLGFKRHFINFLGLNFYVAIVTRMLGFLSIRRLFIILNLKMMIM